MASFLCLLILFTASSNLGAVRARRTTPYKRTRSLSKFPSTVDQDVDMPDVEMQRQPPKRRLEQIYEPKESSPPNNKKIRRGSLNLRVDNVGVFSGMHLDRNFLGSEHWDRHCEHHQVRHHVNNGDEVFTGLYNTCSGVSDIVYYKINPSAFASGKGRGGDWTDDAQLKEHFTKIGKTRNEYATVTDYQGVGLFDLNRGHQAPVASFNADHDRATLTNTPSNLSPQSAYLNQRHWTYLETDMRLKGGHEGQREAPQMEMLTGPLYELPRAMLDNVHGSAMWKQLLDTSGIQLSSKQKPTPWCPVRDVDGNFRSVMMLNTKGKPRSEMMSCKVKGSHMHTAGEDPNKLRIAYAKGPRNFPLRTPLGYFKLMLLKSGGQFGRRTCAYIMDQVGQCLLVSIELLGKIAHFDFQGTEWASKGGLDIQDRNSKAEYNAYVNPYFCVPPGGTLRKKNACLYKTNTVTDAENITLDMMDHYWKNYLQSTAGD